MKKSSEVWILQRLVIRSCGWLAVGKLPKAGTCVKHAKELKSHTSCCTTGQKSQAGQVVSSQLELMTQSSRKDKSPDHSVWEKLTFRIPNTHLYIYPLFPRIVKSF